MNEAVEEIKETMCDEYCKFPSMAGENELAEICENCPLNKLGEAIEQGE